MECMICLLEKKDIIPKPLLWALFGWFPRSIQLRWSGSQCRLNPCHVAVRSSTLLCTQQYHLHCRWFHSLPWCRSCNFLGTSLHWLPCSSLGPLWLHSQMILHTLPASPPAFLNQFFITISMKLLSLVEGSSVEEYESSLIWPFQSTINSFSIIKVSLKAILCPLLLS